MPRILFLGDGNARRDLVTQLAASGYEIADLQAESSPNVTADLALIDLTSNNIDLLTESEAAVVKNLLPVVVLADAPPSAPVHDLNIAGWLVAPFDNLEVIGTLRAALHARAASNGYGDPVKLRELLERAKRERDSFAQADQKKDEFISYISHELKNPMASIKGYSDLMRRRLNKIPDDPNRKGLEIISAQVGRMTVLLDQLLDFSRINMDRLQLDFRPVDVVQLIERLIEETQPTTNKHALQLVVDVDSHVVMADENRLRQALQYLVANAIKFSPESGTIVIALEQGQDEFAALAIRDKGIGIPAADQKRVFERFFRASNVDEGQAGLGLGLFLANEIIARHNGRITVESEEGQGSTFTVLLPVAQSS